MFRRSKSRQIDMVKIVKPKTENPENPCFPSIYRVERVTRVSGKNGGFWWIQCLIYSTSQPYKTGMGVDLINFLEFCRSNRKKLRSNFVLWSSQQVHWTVDPTKTLYHELKLNVWIEINSYIWLKNRLLQHYMTVNGIFEVQRFKFSILMNWKRIFHATIPHPLQDWRKLMKNWFFGVMCSHWIQNSISVKCRPRKSTFW